MERRLHAALFNNTQNDVRLRINLSRGLQGPPLPLRIEHADMVFVLKVKIELALRLLRETGHGTSGPLPKAEDIELEFRGVPLRDMMAIDRYGIDSGAELVASYVPQPPERNLVPHEPGFVNLEELIMAEAGVPSTGAIKRIINRTGKMCCVCWRSRWFRATVLEIYSTSLLLKWHDWPDAEWPNFFVKVALAAAPNTPPAPHDETWRIRWHHTTPVRELPVVQPKFSELPPLNWVKAFLRTYASRDEMGLLREVQSQLPREMVEAKQASFARHRCLVIGASNVGKSTLIQTICDGPPPNERAGGLAGAMPLLGGRTARTSRTSRTSRTTNRATGRMGSGGGESGYDLGMDSVENAHVKQPYWPTVGTTLYKASVSAPGLPALPLELFDTSGNPRFKPLSLVFYRQAQSVVLVFDVKSMRSFRALGEVGGWLHEFTRLTGLSPHNFPFVLVGNKSEDDVMHPRQVFEEDVREWLYTQVGRMPYIETSFGGDPRQSWRHAEHVFRTIARTTFCLKENLGRHVAPETVRVADEPDYVDEAEQGLAGFARESLRNGSFVQDAPDMADKLFKPLASWAKQAGDDLRKKWDEGVSSLQERLPLSNTGKAGAARAGANANPLECLRMVPRKEDAKDGVKEKQQQQQQRAVSPPKPAPAPVPRPPSSTKGTIVVAQEPEEKHETAKRKGVSTSKLRSALVKHVAAERA